MERYTRGVVLALLIAAWMIAGCCPEWCKKICPMAKTCPEAAGDGGAEVNR